MTIAAFEIHEVAVRRADWFHVNRVIQLDGGGIAFQYSADRAQHCELEMAFLKTANLSDVSRIRTTGFQISVAADACFVANGRKAGAAAMLGVAGRAIERGSLGGMMSRAIVAGDAGVVGGFGGKRSRRAYVAGGALFSEYGMGPRQAATGVDAMVAGESTPDDPEKRKQRQRETEPKLGALGRRRPLEIIEVDALRRAGTRKRSLVL